MSKEAFVYTYSFLSQVIYLENWYSWKLLWFSIAENYLKLVVTKSTYKEHYNWKVLINGIDEKSWELGLTKSLENWYWKILRIGIDEVLRIEMD